MSKVSIVILNWNGRKDTIECLKSLQKINHDNFVVEIVIVDNGSHDDSIEKISDFIKNVPNHFLLKNNKNYGFAEGNNVGIRFAIKRNSDFVLILNNDTIVDKNFLVALLSTANKYQKFGSISPKIYFAKGYEFHKNRYKKPQLGSVIWYRGGQIDWNNVYASNKDVDLVDNFKTNKVFDTDFTTGAAMLLNVTALKKLDKFFDPKYFLYMEDVDLCMRLKKKGFEILCDPKSIIWHKVSQSSGIGSNLNDYFITRNRLMFGMRYARLRAKIALLKEAVRFIAKGRMWQKIAVMDFLIQNTGKGSWK